MKYTTNYVIGNTAIRFVETGNRIKVINVNEQQKRRIVIRGLVLTLLMSSLLIFFCCSTIQKNNEAVMLSQQIVHLNSEIEVLEKKTDDMKRTHEVTIDYDQLFQEAKSRFGMCFPKRAQVYFYQPIKSNAVRVNE